MQVCTSLQTDNHASTPPLSFYRPDALPATQPTASKHWRHRQTDRHTCGYLRRGRNRILNVLLRLCLSQGPMKMTVWHRNSRMLIGPTQNRNCILPTHILIHVITACSSTTISGGELTQLALAWRFVTCYDRTATLGHWPIIVFLVVSSLSFYSVMGTSLLKKLQQ